MNKKNILTVFLILFLITSCSTTSNYYKKNPEITVTPVEPDQAMVVYEGKLLNIFFHPVVARPEIAFKGSEKDHFLEWFVTADEFRRILHEMYMDNYVLVNIDEFYDVTYTNGVKRVTIKKLLVPEGKKPFVLSIDDLNYYKYMRNNGMVHKLVIDKNGKLAAWTANVGGGELSYNLDNITITEDFIKQHPDFSVRGARGIIALTGFEGVFGYQTHRKNTPGYSKEEEGAIAVANKLKEMGWRFASHSYAHSSMPDISMESFLYDINTWDRDVRPILGNTDLYIYPFGNGVEAQKDKHRILREKGFNLFFCVGPGWDYHQLTEYILIYRRNIDGFYFREYRNRRDRLFDIDKVIDKEYRTAR
jgi:uncharacterized pyridoxamine 5'-phosphate oxidase family protein